MRVCLRPNESERGRIQLFESSVESAIVNKSLRLNDNEFGRQFKLLKAHVRVDESV